MVKLCRLVSESSLCSGSITEKGKVILPEGGVAVSDLKECSAFQDGVDGHVSPHRLRKSELRKGFLYLIIALLAKEIKCKL